MAEELESISGVSKVRRKSRVSPTDMTQAVERVPPNTEKFNSLVQKQPEVTVETQFNAQKSLLEEVREVNSKVGRIQGANADQIVAQAEQIITQIDQIKEKLGSPNLQVKESVQTLMRNRLSHIDDNLRIALDRAGLEYVPIESRKAKDLSGPFNSFLSSLTHAQSQLETLSTDVKGYHERGKSIDPAAMLAVQIKVGFIQTELEFFSSLLNKALESTKTIMNVQV